jgi:phosphoribosyl-AMP cyclohydrolase
MNAEALEKTLAEGRVHVFRRSRGEVVPKGVDSGHVQEVEEIRINCDSNSLEIRVRQKVAACAYGYYSCYFRRWDEGIQGWVVDDEQVFDPDEVYRKR